ncbi:MAG: hypothetical protein K2R98_17520 [Gemmataceae bacterium]|nr:hypothetical protein [Gemmataceae bacterium]
MPSPVRCPKCQHLGKVPEQFIGLRVRCKKCSHPFEARLDTPSKAVQQPSARGSKPVPPPPMLDDDATLALDDLDLVLPPLPPSTPAPPSALKPSPAVQLPAMPKPPPGNFVMQVEEPTKVCPFCSEKILATAKKCKHCGEFLLAEVVASAAPMQQQPAPAPLVVVAPPPPKQVGFHCPYCNTCKPPYTQRKVSTAGWIFFWVLLLFLCLPLCWIGLFMCEDQKVCSSCGIKLG